MESFGSFEKKNQTVEVSRKLGRVIGTKDCLNRQSRKQFTGKGKEIK